MNRQRLFLLPVVLLALLLPGQQAAALPFAAARARLRIVDLDLKGAAEVLSAENGAEATVEKGRLALYRGDCDKAARLLERPDVVDIRASAPLRAVALGCARATAAALTVRDPVAGVVVRFQDDADAALFPLLVETAAKVRRSLQRDLDVLLPKPLWIDLVRDQLSLAALSGLPEKAAQTTGTVAVAKWGRVMMLSPRAAPHGYGWLDTLAHEMTHLALSQATRDRAPLWLQEGVAKRQETRWRLPQPYDTVPSHDAVAANGIARGLGLALTGLGPSIAMLPSATQATVAFAEVASFIGWWIEKRGPKALPKLLRALRDAAPQAKAADAIKQVSGKSLARWELSWRHWLKSRPRPLAAPFVPGGRVKSAKEVAQRRRLGVLLHRRGHHEQSIAQLRRAQQLLPKDASLRCHLVDALVAAGHTAEARSWVAQPKDILLPTAEWWSWHSWFELQHALPGASFQALANNPLAPAVACNHLPWDELPQQKLARSICQAARRPPFQAPQSTTN